MLEKLKKNLDDAFHGIKNGASKVTLKAEERTKLTRYSMRINTLKKDMDLIMMRVGNELYTFRDEQRSGIVFEDPTLAEILDEADELKEKMVNLQQEMDQTREDYELRIKGLDIPAGVETTESGEETEKIAKTG